MREDDQIPGSRKMVKGGIGNPTDRSSSQENPTHESGSSPWSSRGPHTIWGDAETRALRALCCREGSGLGLQLLCRDGTGCRGSRVPAQPHPVAEGTQGRAAPGRLGSADPGIAAERPGSHHSRSQPAPPPTRPCTLTISQLPGVPGPPLAPGISAGHHRTEAVVGPPRPLER
nr:uncharacterized protein LOC103893058 isoform X1 [Pongo abelii]